MRHFFRSVFHAWLMISVAALRVRWLGRGLGRSGFAGLRRRLVVAVARVRAAAVVPCEPATQIISPSVKTLRKKCLITASSQWKQFGVQPTDSTRSYTRNHLLAYLALEPIRKTEAKPVIL